MATASKIGIGIVGGVGMGAAVMFLLEPARKRRRLARRTGDGAVAGVLADLRAELDSDDIPPEALVGRVRAVVERTVSQPSAVAVRIEESHIRLSGPVTKREAHAVVRHVRQIAGSRAVDDQLDRRSRQSTARAAAR